jgi:hypothetical protein
MPFAATDMRGQVIKSSVMRSVVSTVALGLALVGCSQSEPGTASPKDTTTTVSSGQGSKSSATDTTSNASGSNDSFSQLKACALLNEASSLGLTGVQEKNSNSCQGIYQGAMIVRVVLYSDKGLKDYNLGPQAEPSDTKVGTHQAKLVKKALTKTACSVVVGVSDSSRIDVNATSDDNLDASCDLATKVATAAEPKLP